MGEKHYTFELLASFKFQFTFTEDQIERDPEGAEGAVQPTEKALAALQDEIGGAV